MAIKKTTKKETAETTSVEKKTTRKTTARKTTTRKKSTKKEEGKKEEELTIVAAQPVEETPAPQEELVTGEENVTAAEENKVSSDEKNSGTEEKTIGTEEKKVAADEKKVVTEEKKTVTTDEKGTQKEAKPIPEIPMLMIRSIVDLINAPHRQILLSDQQIQQLTLEEANNRFRFIEGALAWVLNYDVVITDTNIWLELLVGHTSSHSDPRVNARLLFERQLEFISRLVRFRGARFLMMSETYEEIDRFATMQAPTNYKEADFTDEAVCRNTAGRLAKRLILSLQRENRLRIEGITSESHHSAFADPAIIRRTVELFAQGKRVLVITNDASVGIRSIGMCDDLQRTNNIDDETWENVYTPLRPMVFTMDDLKLLDNYTRQLHFLQMAAGKQWMEDVPQSMAKSNVAPLTLWKEGFRPGDKYAESKNNDKQKLQNSDSQREKNEQKQQQKQDKQPQKQDKQQLKQDKQQLKQEKQQLKTEQTQQLKTEQTQQQKQQKKVKQPQQNPAEDTAVQNAPEVQETPVTPEITPQEEALQEATQQPAQKKRIYRRPQRRKKSDKENQ